MTDQDQGNQPTPEEPANLADQVNEVFEQAKLDDDVEPATENAAGDTEEAADPVAAIQRELDERTEDLQRLSAEFANYRRRVDRDREAERVQAKAKLAGELLVLADDLDRAEDHGDLADGTPLKAFADKFRGVLTAQGVEEFGAAGEEFNPDIHEAVQDLSEGDDKVLANVLRKGYRINDRVIRTAMVIIGDPQ